MRRRAQPYECPSVSDLKGDKNDEPDGLRERHQTFYRFIIITSHNAGRRVRKYPGEIYRRVRLEKQDPGIARYKVSYG